MSPGELFWHLSNFFAVAVLFGAIAAAAAKLIWRRALAAITLQRLLAWCVGTAAVVQALGLIALGTDGRMLTYAAMVVAVAALLAWHARRN